MSGGKRSIGTIDRPAPEYKMKQAQIQSDLRLFF